MDLKIYGGDFKVQTEVYGFSLMLKFVIVPSNNNVKIYF